MKSASLLALAVGAAFVAAACGSSSGTATAQNDTPKTDAAPGGAPAAQPVALTSPATFETMQPFLAANCLRCHGAGKKVAGGFNLTSYAAAMKGGEDGVMIKPGDPEGSMLINYLKGTKKPQMPKGGAPISESDIQVISDWIKAGAKEK